MEIFDYVEIDAAIDDYITDVGADSMYLDRNRLRRVANDVVTKLSFKQNMVHKVGLHFVENYRIDLDENLYSVVQALYKNVDHRDDTIRREKVVEWTKQMYTESGCDVDVTVNCEDCVDRMTNGDNIVVDVDYLFRHNNPQLVYQDRVNRFGGLDNNARPLLGTQNGWRILKPKQHNFAGANQQVGGGKDINKVIGAGVENQGEYWLDYPKMYTNFKKGAVLLSTLEYKADENGYRMIPNLPDVFDAIKWAIEEKEMYRQYRKTQNRQFKQDSNEARQKREIAMGRAREALRLVSMEDWYAFMDNVFMKMYYPSHGNLGAWQEDGYSKWMSRLTRK